MTAHELAKKLLEGPDLKVFTENTDEWGTTVHEVEGVFVGVFVDAMCGPSRDPTEEELKEKVLISKYDK